MDVSVVVPVYGNADTLHELHQRTAGALQKAQLTFELILVDDACPRGSASVIDEIGRSDARVNAAHLGLNVGQHRALLAGLKLSTGRWAVLMDADLQDPPEAIPMLVEEGERGYPVVFAGRRGNYQSPSRMMSGRMYRTILHLSSGLPRDAGAFVAIRRDAVERLLSLRGPAPFIPAMLSCIGLPLKSVPVARARRPAGESAYSPLLRMRSARRAFAWILWRRTHAGFASEHEPSTRFVD